ncbi:MAG TPA: phosphoesterase [Desulfuromonas sp.]|nr:phosphoesterase [Desulfuromonas sp.]HBT83352.1 phosphoesterase [Desulfuromonas sp.]
MLSNDPRLFRQFVNDLVEWLRGKGRILIVAHDAPDPDALASACALQALILVRTGQEAVITYGGVIGRRENRVMVEELGIEAVPIHLLDLDLFDVVCMVDTQPGVGNNAWPPERPVHVVIDHHPLREGTARCHWVDVREEFGACATILYEYLVVKGVYISTRLATMLFYAIKTETQDLGREWVKADRDAYQELIPLCNNHILARIVHPKVPQDYFVSFHRAMAGARIYDKVLVFDLHNVANPDIVAEMADFLLRAEGVETVFGLAECNGGQVLSMRTDREDLSAGTILRDIVGELGHAGGHGRIAGGQIPLASADAANRRRLVTTLKRRLFAALEVSNRRGQRLLSPR